MKSLLEALKEGRLIELPSKSKEESLELLAHLIEAIPDIGIKDDILKGILKREGESTTAIGKGIACPHCRIESEGELLCAVGWSPEGIEYGAQDGVKVHLLVMYLVPNSERNAYLKEISGLAKAIQMEGERIESVESLPDIHSVRDKMLDWAALAINEMVPQTKAKMIKLEARQAIASIQAQTTISGLKFMPFRLISWPAGFLVLCKDPEMSAFLEGSPDLAKRIDASRELELPDCRIAVLSVSSFANDRKEYEAVAVRMMGS